MMKRVIALLLCFALLLPMTAQAAESIPETTTEETVPETSVPETSTPEETTPGTSVPETTVPEEAQAAEPGLYERLTALTTLEEIYALLNAETETALEMTAEEVEGFEQYVVDLFLAMEDPTDAQKELYTQISEYIQELKVRLGIAECICGTETEAHDPECPLFVAAEDAAVLLDTSYIYFDLFYGDVQLTDTTYSGWVYNGTGQPVYQTGTHSANNQYYIFQSNGETLKGIPQYSRVMGGAWGDYITNNTDVLAVIANWNTEAAKVGRQETPSASKLNDNVATGNPDVYVQQHHRIIIQNSGSTATNYNVTIDNVWSGFQNDDCKDANGNIYTGMYINDGPHYRKSGGLTFRPGSDKVTAHIYLKGDNRFGNIHYDVGASAGGSVDSDIISSRIEQLFFHNGEASGNPAGTLTVANLDGNSGANHFDSVIGGANSPNNVPGLVFNGGIIYAGATELDNCTAIGGGGCGFGGVTINGGKITAVTASNGTAIGGGIGDGANGGAGNILITGGEVYAYNFGLAIEGTRVSATNNTNLTGTDAEIVYAVMPAVAIGSGSSRRNYTVPAEITITGGKVYAQSTGGTAIGGGSSNNYDGARATINISGGEITAKSVPGTVRVIHEYDKGQTPSYVSAKTQNVSASTSIGGGTVGVPFMYQSGEIKDQGSGGDCILNISGNPIIRAGSIGGGGANVLPDPTSGELYADRYANVTAGKIGSAQVTISGGVTQGQVIMAKGAEMDCFFRMTGGTIDNATKDDSFVFLKENGGAVYVENGNATMSGGTIQNCDDAKNGGVFYVEGGSVTISGGTIQNNSAINGGAAYVHGGSVTMTNGTISQCSATDVGGGFYISGGSMTMTNGVLENNMATSGAAGYVANGNFTMTSGIMRDNGTLENTEYGGAVYVNGGNMTIGLDGCTQTTPHTDHMAPGFHPIVENNAAKFGGGLAVSGGNLTIYCSDIANNTSDNAGTGENIFMDGGVFNQHYGGADIGEDTDHGVVMIGGNMQILGTGNVPLMKIQYHDNYSTGIWVAENVPLNYWLNLPYCPQKWSDEQAAKNLVFVGWSEYETQNMASNEVRSIWDYKPIGQPFQVNELGEPNKDGVIELWAVWAPLESRISYAYSLGTTADPANSIVQIPDSETDHEIFAGQIMPRTYQFTKATTTVDVPTPAKEGYTFKGWKMYAKLSTIANWNADAYEAKIVDGQSVVTFLDPATNLSQLKDLNMDTVDNFAWPGTVQQNFGDIVLVAVFQENYSTIQYQIVGPDGEECGSLTSTTETILTVNGTPAGTTAKVNPGYKIIGWFTDAACTQPVSDEFVSNSGVGYTHESILKPDKYDGDIWANPTVYYVKFGYAVADLIVTIDDHDPGYDYIFTITGTPADGTVFEPLKIVLHGEQDSITVKDLPIGEYTVTMDKNWAWRFTQPSQDENVDGKGEHRVDFNSLTAENPCWMDNSTSVTNLFTKTKKGTYKIQKVKRGD